MRPIKLFLSYSHKDEDLREQLVAHLSVLRREGVIEAWHDRDIEIGTEWKTSISSHLEEAQIILLLVSADFLASDYCYEKELRRAMERHEAGEATVVPIILRPCDWSSAPFSKLQGMPTEMQPVTVAPNRDHAFCNIAISIRKLTDRILHTATVAPTIATENTARRNSAFLATADDWNYVARPDEYENVIGDILSRENRTDSPHSVALLGAGGCGKTTLARAITRDRRIETAFGNQILGATLGEHASDYEVARELSRLIRCLAGTKEGFDDPQEAVFRITEILQDQPCFIVIDDVWRRELLSPFLQLGSHAVVLTTTRNADVLPRNTRITTVGAMSSNEALHLLALGLEQTDALASNHTMTALRRLTDTVGQWPLLLRLANGALRERIALTNQRLPEAVHYVQTALDKRGVTAFDASNSDLRGDAVAKTIEVSLDLLTPSERDRYAELAIFPGRLDIPLATVTRYWKHNGATDGFHDAFYSEEFCVKLRRLSLLISFDSRTLTIRLHDIVRQYLLGHFRPRLAYWQTALIEAHRLQPLPGQVFSGPVWRGLSDNDPYLWDYLTYHLAASGMELEALETVQNVQYLAKKIRLRSVAAAIEDVLAVERRWSDDALVLLVRKLSQIDVLLATCKDECDVENTLFCRLYYVPEFSRMFRDFEQTAPRPFFAPLRKLPDEPPPWLVRTIPAHAEPVNGCAISADGRAIASACADGTLAVWDPQSGAKRFALKGHSASVNACAINADGSVIVSVSGDKTVKLWDGMTGRELMTLTGHQTKVTGCAITPDSRYVASVSESQCLLWDGFAGTMLQAMTPPEDGRFNNCSISDDGRMVLMAGNGHLYFWDTIDRGSVTLCSHEYILRRYGCGGSGGTSESTIYACSASSDMRTIVSASITGAVSIWDGPHGPKRFSLSGHLRSAFGCTISRDGKLAVSASGDGTVMAWDAGTGTRLGEFVGHSGAVNDCHTTLNGEIVVSGGADGTVRVWDTRAGDSGLVARPYGTAKVIKTNTSSMVIYTEANCIRIFDGGSESERLMIPGSFEFTDVSADESTIVTVSSEIAVWDATRGIKR